MVLMLTATVAAQPSATDRRAGAHTWINWRNYLGEFAPLLFR